MGGEKNPYIPLLDTLNLRTGASQGLAHSHLRGAAAGEEFGLKDEVTNDLERVLQVAFDLVQHIFRSATEEDSTGFRIVALLQEAEVFVAV